MINLAQLQNAARVALEECMATKKEESVLLVIDEPMIELGEIFYEEGRRLGFEIMLVKMIARENHGCEPPRSIASAMANADVVFCITSKSLSHTNARRGACQKGTRVASMPALTEEMMQRTLAADYTKIAKVSNKIAKVLTDGQKVTITSPHGTNLKMEIVTRLGQPDTGLLHQAGDFGNLPAGEAYIAPLEGTTTGKLVIDGAMSGIGILQEPLVMEVEQGQVVSVAGKDSSKLEAIFAKYGDKARNIAELGIGTNHEAKLTGIILEDEKVLGTIHIALGDNSTFGGNVEVASHLDGIITSPSVVIDGKAIMEDGKLLID
ncbi:MAG: aminopeptidase [Bacillota bacterium]|nr:aminopeptidase [Bacillota bacterium]